MEKARVKVKKIDFKEKLIELEIIFDSEQMLQELIEEMIDAQKREEIKIEGLEKSCFLKNTWHCKKMYYYIE